MQGDPGAGGLKAVQAVFDHLRSLDGDLNDFFFGFAEHVLPLCRGSAVVHVDDHLFRAEQGFDGFFNQVLTRLHQALDGDIVRDALLFDEAAVETEFCV